MLPAVVAFFSLFFLLSCGFGRVPQPGNDLQVEAIPIELGLENAGRNPLGRLTFLSGFELKSADSRFGGLSGLALSPDGKTLHAVSDRGYWLSAMIRHDPEGRLATVGPWQIGLLLTPDGTPVTGWLRDAEALTRERDGSLIVSFEQVHRLWRYPPPPAAFRSRPQTLPVPADLEKAPNNGGLEAVAALPDGRLLMIAEEYKNTDGSLKGWLIDRDQFAPISYLVSDGFRPADLAALANGDVLVLESRFSWFGGWAARVQRVSRESLRPEARLQGEEISRLESPLIIDNLEGIAVREDPETGTFLYLISDNNYSQFQRTLLLQFRLEKDRGN